MNLYKRYHELITWDGLLTTDESKEMEVLKEWYGENITYESAIRKIKLLKAMDRVL